MSDLIETKVIDNYLEHSQHLIADPQCSTCYNNPPLVTVNEEGYIVPQADNHADWDTKQIDKDDMMVGVSYDEDIKEEGDELDYSPEEI